MLSNGYINGFGFNFGLIEQRKIAQQQIKDFETKENAETAQIQFVKNQLEQSFATPKSRFLMAMLILSLLAGGFWFFNQPKHDYNF